MTRKLIAVLTAGTVLLSSVVCAAAVLSAGAESAYVNNADVMPKYVDDSQVKLEDSGGGLMSPDWLKTLMIVEINPVFASSEQTLAGLSAVLDHYQEAGINGLWLTPVYDEETGLGHYANYGPGTISHLLTGTTDYTEGWKRFKAFVDEAHSKNIRIFLDSVTWGVSYEAPLAKEHPEWIGGESSWGGWAYDWTNEEFREWFINTNVKLVTDIGIDGFRCDCEPGTTGYDIFGEIRTRALKKGEKIAIFSENVCERLQPTYDFDEHQSDDDTCWTNWDMYIEKYNIVDAVKEGLSLGTKFMQQTGEAGTSRFYSYRLSCHDSTDYHANGSLTSIGYQAILSPFIPIWFMGEEYDNPLTAGGQGGIIYRNPLNLAAVNQTDNRAFYEQVKKLIRIRRQYPAIFNNFTKNHRDGNICKVDVYGLETLQAYARFADGKGVIVVPNNNVHDKTSPFTVAVPFAAMGIENNTQYRVTDLLTGKVIAKGNRTQVQDFKAAVAYDTVGVYLVEAVGDKLPDAPSVAATTTRASTTTAPRPQRPTSDTDSVTTSTVEPEDVTTSAQPEETSAETAATTAKSRKTKVVMVPVEVKTPGWVYAAIIGGAVLVLAAVAAILLWLRNKKKHPAE